MRTVWFDRTFEVDEAMQEVQQFLGQAIFASSDRGPARSDARFPLRHRTNHNPMAEPCYDEDPVTRTYRGLGVSQVQHGDRAVPG